MKSKLLMRGVAGILAVLVLFSGLSADPVYAKKNKKESGSLQISSAEDFVEFAKNCHSDQWSRGRTVTLTKDIDLSDTEFEMIPVFAGVFDGDGHTIRGLRYGDGKYVAGLFRYIAEEAVVKNLTLEAAITSTDEQQCVGGICGENSGLIENCSFCGSVDGRSETGGIAGVNTAAGTIRGCESVGVITGLYDTGGIVGKNHGLITRCVNRAGVNNSKEWVSQEDESGLDWLKTLRNEDESASLQSGVDTGGIAGYSDGAISFCENHAVIGYEHTGYNIGGIAGRQAGLLSLSENFGEVYGRKDVGGVVGQMEPYIRMDEVASVEDAVEKLHALIEKLLDDIDASGDTISTNYHTLMDSADDALDNSHTIAGQVTDFADDNVAAVNELSDRIKFVIDALPDIQENVSDALSLMSVINQDLDKINEDFAIVDQMKDKPYTGASYDRLTLLSSVGGELAADNSSPARGAKVTLTAKAKDGYRPDHISAYDAHGASVAVSKNADGTYSFSMPEQNVVVQASFSYAGRYMAKSNAGGRISFSETDTQITIHVQTDSDYALETLTVGGKMVAFGADESIIINKADYPLNEKVVMIEGFFKNTSQPQEDAGPDSGETRHAVSTLMATGGIVTVDSLSAEKNTSVRVTAVAAREYRADTVTVIGKNSGTIIYSTAEGRDTCEFVMPDEDVTVAAAFCPVPFAIVSNVGGSADYSIDGSKVTFTIHPAAGYSVSGAPVVKDSTGKALAVAKQRSDTEEYMVDISGALGCVTASLVFGAQNQYDALKSALETMDGSSGQMQSAMNQSKLLVDEISSILTDSSGNPREWSKIGKDDRSTVLKDVIDLAKQLAAAGSAAARMAGSISVVINITQEYTLDTAEKLNTDLKALNGHMQEMIDCLNAAASAVTAVTDYLAIQPNIQFVRLGDEFEESLDALYQSLLDISGEMDQLEQDISAATKTITKDFREINDQMNVVFLLFMDRIDQLQNPDAHNYYQDVSEEEIESAATGKVKNCTNYGVVEGDINVGGVAGSMAVDEEDPEDNAAGTSQLTLGAVYQTRCILQASKNYGYIKAKKDGAGGVIGFMKLGVVTACEAYGGIKSTEGDYVGGICGDSTGIIRKSFALCRVEGGSYVGGIAGYGEGIYNCCAMTDTFGEGSRIGAIAGQVGERNASGSRNQADYAKNNYYVGDAVYGIDSISYVGVAEPTTYEKLLSTEGLPNDYSHLQISFVIDGVCVAKEELPYGAALDTLQMPQIPDKDGQNGVWPDVAGNVMTTNRVLEAEYMDNITVLESEELVAESSLKRPCAFVEGTFTQRARLNAQLLPEGSSLEPPVSAGVQIYEIILTDTRLADTDESELRLWNAYGNDADVYLYTDGGWRLLESKNRGGYRQVTMTGTGQVFAVAKTKDSKFYIYIIIAGCAALTAVVIFAVRRHVKKTRGRQKKKLP